LDDAAAVVVAVVVVVVAVVLVLALEDELAVADVRLLSISCRNSFGKSEEDENN
jgi:hypothetical protein